MGNNNTLLKKLNFQNYSYFSNIFVRNHQNTTLTIYLLFFQNREKIFLDIHIQIFLPNTEDNILPWLKVETINDSYMVASGLPERNGDRHAAEIASLCLELMVITPAIMIHHDPGLRLRIRSPVINSYAAKYDSYQLNNETSRQHNAIIQDLQERHNIS